MPRTLFPDSQLLPLLPLHSHNLLWTRSSRHQQPISPLVDFHGIILPILDSFSSWLYSCCFSRHTFANCSKQQRSVEASPAASLRLLFASSVTR